MSKRTRRTKTPSVTPRNVNPHVDTGGAPLTPQAAQQRITQLERREFFKGPLPHPDHIAQYEAIHPGLADRIVRMAEEEAIHRREMERQIIAAEAHDARWGQRYAFLVVMVVIAGATYAATQGAQWFATIIGVGGLAGIVSTFIIGRKRRL